MAQLTSILGVKDFFLLLLMIGFFSLLLTYHIGLNLPRPPEGHEEIKDVHPLKFHQNWISSENNFKNQQHKDVNNQHHLSDATQKLNLLDQIFKVICFMILYYNILFPIYMYIGEFITKYLWNTSGFK